MLESMLVGIRMSLVRMLVNRVLHCIARSPDSGRDWDIGVFCDSVRLLDCCLGCGGERSGGGRLTACWSPSLLARCGPSICWRASSCLIVVNSFCVVVVWFCVEEMWCKVELEADMGVLILYLASRMFLVGKDTDSNRGSIRVLIHVVSAHKGWCSGEQGRKRRLTS